MTQPPCTAMPLTIEPIACSRMPNAMLRPAQSAREEPAADELGLRRLDEVGGAADHRRHGVLERLHDRLAGVARREVLAGLPLRQLPRADAARPRGVPPFALARERLRPRRKLLLPRGFGRAAALDAVHVRVDLVRHVEVLVRVPAERALRRRDLFGAERRAVRLRGVDRVRRAVGDVRAHDDHRRPARSPPARSRSPRAASRGR